MGSADTKFPVRYEDPEYQSNHQRLFSGALLTPLEQVLPPCLSQQDFDRVIKELQHVVGKEFTFIGAALEEYVDPYELWEKEGRRRIPSAAVW